MEDSQFMTVAQKLKTLRQWEQFLKSGLSKGKFTKPLYNHLIQHCLFIAHYDLQGFYSTYFEKGEDTAHFLTQFDNRNGIPKSVEYGMIDWYTDLEYNDINSEMCRVASKYIPGLIERSINSQRDMDVLQAKSLLAKHGLKASIRE